MLLQTSPLHCSLQSADTFPCEICYANLKIIKFLVCVDVRGVCLSVCLSTSLSVCMSRGSSRLHCAKVAEQIKMLFGVNTPRGPWNIVLDVGPDTPTESERGLLLNFGTPSSPERLKLKT